MGKTTRPGEKEREIIIEPVRRTTPAKPEPAREPAAPPKRKKEPAKQ